MTHPLYSPLLPGGAQQQAGGGLNLTQNVDDTLSLADALAFGQGKAIADTLALADARAFGRDIHLADSVSFTDARSFQRDVHLANENVAINDSQVVSRGLNRTIADVLSRNEIRTLTITDIGTISGTFTFTFKGQTTGALDFDATASETLAALEALTNIDPGDVTVTDLSLGAGETLKQRIEFTGQYAAQDITTNPSTGFAGNFGSLVDAGVSFANTQQGTTGVDDVLVASGGLGVSIDDTLGVADALAFGRGKGINETVPLSETLRFDRGMVVADTVPLSETVRFDRGLRVADTLGLADLATPEENPFVPDVDEAWRPIHPGRHDR